MNLLTWHVHGSYLYYLSHLPHRIYVPKSEPIRPGYAGRPPGFPWPDQLIEVHESEIASLKLDAVIYQSRTQYEIDRLHLLSAEQQRLPSLYLEHDPPQEHPTGTRHPVQSSETMLVHVTAFNRLMWDAGPTPTTVIEHGVPIPPAALYKGEINRGIVVINNIRNRGRRLGYDIWEHYREQVPLDLYGMGWKEAGGVREAKHTELPSLMGQYRFFFNPIRYTSLGLAVCEAMAVGLPVVGLATTEMTSVIVSGENGFIDTEPERLLEPMRAMLREPGLAEELGRKARETAIARFSLERFIDDWNQLLAEVVGNSTSLLIR